MPSAITIASLHLYPLKGCAAVDVESMAISPEGLLVGDRAAVAVDAESGEFVSQRHLGAMALLRARIVGADAIELSWPSRPSISVRHNTPAETIRVTIWDDTFDADDGGDAAAAWLSSAIGRPVRLAWLRSPTGRTLDPFWSGGDRAATSFADLAPALVINAASLDELNLRRGEAGMRGIEMSRFRPNIVLAGLDAFAEDSTPVLRTADGRVTIRLIKPCARCSVPELDPATGLGSGDEVLRSLASFRTLTNRRGTRGILFGQNAIFETSGGGSLRVGGVLVPAGGSSEIA